MVFPKLGISIHFWQDWTNILPWKVGDFNWHTFYFLQLYAEFGAYKGNYFELCAAFMGLGVEIEVYDKAERHSYSRELTALQATWLRLGEASSVSDSDKKV